jgi:formylglycine-generating enzyme required for sulfatase activity
VPTNNVSWYEAAQFVNWLNTSTGHQAAYKFTGTQGQGDYALDTWSPAEAYGGTNLYRHKDAMYYMPTEDEWVKAGYWNGSNLQTYANAGDTLPRRLSVRHGVELLQRWNDGYPQMGPSPGMLAAAVEELNGTYDMMGNVWEWMESPYLSDTITEPVLVAGCEAGRTFTYGDFLASSDRTQRWRPRTTSTTSSGSVSPPKSLNLRA